jgi:hypothetical protein
MKQLVLIFVAMSGLALGQDKPRVFVQGKGSENATTSASGTGGRHWGSYSARSTVDSHDEAMEVTKNMQKDCFGVIITLNQSNADYTVMLNRESKQNRGLLRTNSQVQVANRLGDILGTNATRTVGNASKDACQIVLADWSQHGRMAVPEPPAAQGVVPASAMAPSAEGPRVQTVSAVQPQPPEEATTPIVTEAAANGVDSLGDASKRMKQRKACLELAKSNPSIVCQ